MNDRTRHVLVAGATGYIGRRLVAELIAAGHRVRCLARTPEKLDAESWRDQVEVVAGDVLDAASLVPCFNDIDAAYYLVHSIGSQSDWQTRDRMAAENFRDGAAAAGVEQIVYLGGLGDDAPYQQLSCARRLSSVRAVRASKCCVTSSKYYRS
jgi:uncharacterized protein YbjT (DUF2867 family)